MSAAARSASALAKSKSMHHHASCAEQLPELPKELIELLDAICESAVEEPIRDLVAVRPAQMNGCASALTCMSSRPGCMANASSACAISRHGGNPPCSRLATEVLTKVIEQVSDEIHDLVLLSSLRRKFLT
jgi:hypothetical protein